MGGSKVVRAEVIEKKSGRVLCDLTADDIGVGKDREGAVLWSPDSKRLACLSADLTERSANLLRDPPAVPPRKQTAVYHLDGESFVKVAMPLGSVPGREKDDELQGAVLGHEYVEPIRWKKPNVLILERHEYYLKLKPTELEGIKFNSVHSFDRLYQITATIEPDGKAALVWKLREDR